MDLSRGMPHGFIMESPKDRSGSERLLLPVVDDDESVRESIRESLPDMLKEFGFAAQAFSSAEECLPPIVSRRTAVWFSTSQGGYEWTTTSAAAKASPPD